MHEAITNRVDKFARDRNFTQKRHQTTRVLEKRVGNCRDPLHVRRALVAAQKSSYICKSLDRIVWRHLVSGTRLFEKTDVYYFCEASDRLVARHAKKGPYKFVQHSALYSGQCENSL